MKGYKRKDFEFPLEFFLVASLAAEARDLPFLPDTSLWGEIPKDRQLGEAEFFRQVRQHKLFRSVYMASKESQLPLSESIIRKLKRQSLLEGSIKLGLFQHLGKIQEAFSDYDLEVLVIKGPASSVQLYGDALVRGYLDLDILVDVDSLALVVPIMEKAGYYQKADQNLSTIPSKLVQKIHHAVFFREDSPYRIEVHTSIFDNLSKEPQSRYTTAALLERSVVVSNGETHFKTLDPVDHALFIIEHGTKHGWVLLHWLMDAAKILQIEDPLFHREVASQAEILGDGKKIAYMVKLVTSMFPVPVPSPYAVLVNQYKGHFTTQISYSCKQLSLQFNQRSSLKSILSFTYGFRLPLATGLKEKGEICFQLFKIPLQDTKALPLPRFLFPLHLVLRPFFILRRRFARFLKRNVA
jgi:hypothetical protein